MTFAFSLAVWVARATTGLEGCRICEFFRELGLDARDWFGLTEPLKCARGVLTGMATEAELTCAEDPDH